MNLRYVITTFENQQRTTECFDSQFLPDLGVENLAINLHPEVKDQVFEGFGGAFTESASYMYSCMGQEHKQELLSTYFKPERMNYRFGRITLDSCDFLLGEYEAMSDEKDRTLDSFSLERLQLHILPFIRDAQKTAAHPIEFMLSPWSPPSFMKTNGKRSGGGKLKEGFEEFWADYICRYIQELKKLGVPISRLSLQNEPAAVQKWDSCIYTAEEEKRFLRDYLYPALLKNQLTDIEIFIWDHNKERLYERACTIIDGETDHMIAGAAFHWYSGDHFEALELFRRRFPEKKLILSEACIEYYKYNATNHLAHAQKYAHDIIGNLNCGMNAFYDWNFLLNEEGGPNYVNNFCDAPYLYNRTQGELQEQNILAYLWHFCRFIQPGAIRIGFSRYTDALEVTAFQNPDGTLVGVILNRSNEIHPVKIRLWNEVADMVIKPESIASFEINMSGDIVHKN